MVWISSFEEGSDGVCNTGAPTDNERPQPRESLQLGTRPGREEAADWGRKLSSERLNALTLGVSHLVTPEAPTLYLCL